jgi:hypothetical protein
MLKPFVENFSEKKAEWFITTEHIDLSSDLYQYYLSVSDTLLPHASPIFYAKKQLHCLGNSSKTLKWSYSINYDTCNVVCIEEVRTNLGFLNLKTQLLENNILFHGCFCFSIHILALIPFIANFIYAKNSAKPP